VKTSSLDWKKNFQLDHGFLLMFTFCMHLENDVTSG